MSVESLQSQEECTSSETKLNCLRANRTRAKRSTILLRAWKVWRNTVTMVKRKITRWEILWFPMSQTKSWRANSTEKKTLAFPNNWKSSAPITLRMSWFQLAKTLWIAAGKSEVNSIKERIASSRGRANAGNVLSRVTWQKTVKFPANILAANVEIVGTWRSVVTQNWINKAREEATADVEENLEENETAYGR